ncbi:MAG: hypothetical protein M1385_02285, partial [Candidatus Marsarchaeota archaeon]|nr:hypothetical protein [Candidatus Marsarchaeota archaeon]
MALLSKNPDVGYYGKINDLKKHISSGNRTVAREIISKDIDAARYILSNIDYAKHVCDNSDGSTYAHLVIRKHRSLANEFFNNKSIMEICSNDGWSLYHEAARWHLELAKLCITNDTILSYSNNHGVSVANIILKVYRSDLTENEATHLENIINAHNIGTIKKIHIATNPTNTPIQYNNDNLANIKSNEIIAIPEVNAILNTQDSKANGSVEDNNFETELHNEIAKTVHLLLKTNRKKIDDLIRDDDVFAIHILNDYTLSTLKYDIKKYLGHRVVELNNNAALYAIDNYKIASIKNLDGWSIGHAAVLGSGGAALKAVSNIEIGRLSDEEGRTIMQIAVQTHLDAAVLVFNLNNDENSILSIENDNYESIGQIAIIKWGEIARKIITDPKLYTRIIVSPKRKKNWTFGHEAVMAHASAARRVLESKNEEFKSIIVLP